MIARELTKVYETIHAGTIAELISFVKNDENQQRGEIVLVIAGEVEKISSDKTIETDHILSVLLSSLPLKQAVELTANITGLRKNDLYKRALNTQSQ